jgi:hypothetical protein
MYFSYILWKLSPILRFSIMYIKRVTLFKYIHFETGLCYSNSNYNQLVLTKIIIYLLTSSPIANDGLFLCRGHGAVDSSNPVLVDVSVSQRVSASHDRFVNFKDKFPGSRTGPTYKFTSLHWTVPYKFIVWTMFWQDYISIFSRTNDHYYWYKGEKKKGFFALAQKCLKKILNCTLIVPSYEKNTILD